MDPDNHFMGCDEINKLKVEKKLGCGCVSCAFSSRWRNRTVVIKKLSNKAGRCDRRHSINLFRNQAAWGVQQINHPSILKFHGVCRGLGQPVELDDDNQTTSDQDKDEVGVSVGVGGVGVLVGLLSAVRRVLTTGLLQHIGF